MKARKYLFFQILFYLVFFISSCKQAENVSLLNTKEVSAEVMQTAMEIVEASDLIVVGNITKIYDATAEDAGMSYDVKIENILHGECNDKTLHFNSQGWIGYAKYEKGEKVLLFLRYFGEPSPELIPIVLDRNQVICYIRDGQVEGYSGTVGPLGKMSLERYLDLIKQAGKEP